MLARRLRKRLQHVPLVASRNRLPQPCVYAEGVQMTLLALLRHRYPPPGSPFCVEATNFTVWFIGSAAMLVTKNAPSGEHGVKLLRILRRLMLNLPDAPGMWEKELEDVSQERKICVVPPH